MESSGSETSNECDTPGIIRDLGSVRACYFDTNAKLIGWIQWRGLQGGVWRGFCGDWVVRRGCVPSSNEDTRPLNIVYDGFRLPTYKLCTFGVMRLQTKILLFSKIHRLICMISSNNAG